jgi:hypothetical protein
MSSTFTAPAAALEAAARAAGLTLTAVEPGTDFAGAPTTRATLALLADPAKTLTVELSEDFEAGDAKFGDALASFFSEAAMRLRNPRPDAFLTLHGLPLSFGKFAWPFHASTSGADTYIVHGEIRLEDGKETGLHAKVSAAMTQTFATVVAALEQPFAEGFITNAVRKTLDQGQLELVKSGNRQPVPVTTRYYSMKREQFIFNDTNEQQRHDFLSAKVFWMSHVLGGGAPVWIADPRDAQYLNTTVDELRKVAGLLKSEGLVLLEGDGDWAAATDTLRANEDVYRAQVEEQLQFIKPSFNEEMRGGHTNM